MRPGNQPLRVFRSGRHTSSNGMTRDYTPAELAAAARAYDPAIHEAPIVIGHPKDDTLAMGHIGAAAYDEVADAFKLTPSTVHPVFQEAVNQRLFKHLSMAWYLPESPQNPTRNHPKFPDGPVLYPRHLGAVPIPALKGLDTLPAYTEAMAAGGGAPTVTLPGLDGVVFTEVPAAFAQADWQMESEPDASDTFASWMTSKLSQLSWAFRAMASTLGRLRDEKIAKDGLDAADAAFPKGDVKDLEAAADAMMQGPPPTPAPKAMATTAPAYAEGDAPKDGGSTAMTTDQQPDAAALTARAAELDSREAALTARESALTAQASAAQQTAAAAFVESIKGKVAPQDRAPLAAILANLPVSTVTFGEGDAAKTTPTLDTLQAILTRMGKNAAPTFAEVSGADKNQATDDFAADYAEGKPLKATQVSSAIKAHMAKGDTHAQATRKVMAQLKAAAA